MAFIKITDENGIEHFVNDAFIDKTTGKIEIPETDKTSKTADLSDDQQKMFVQIQTNQSAREYLANTDWYVIRKLETGKEIPTDISQKRIQARANIA
jgi:hypothetical protein